MFKRSFACVAALVLLFVGGCTTAPKESNERTQLRSEADALLVTAQAKSPLVKQYVNTAHGYAVFPSIGEGGFLVAGGYGKGVLYEKGSIIGYTDASQLSIGATIGGQSFSEVIFFETPFALQEFKGGNYSLDAQVSAVALDQSATKAAYSNGVAVVVLDRNGLMAQASVGGQKFRYEPLK